MCVGARASSVATCNAYVTAQAVETAKRINPDVLTVTGCQHFTALAKDSLEAFPELDVVVRCEGEETLTELVSARARAETHRARAQIGRS